MCGIAGFLSLRGAERGADSFVQLRDMVRTLSHRGPDSEGFFEQPGVGMGIRRLRVIDLETGDQPVGNNAGMQWIVFNGEIYNYRELRDELAKKGYRFQTNSDTEVILRLYEDRGLECVHALNGMYAIAIYDVALGKLFLARDPLGIKPLYYYLDNERLVFGSEIKAILAHPALSPRLDLQALSHFLSLNYLPAPHTTFCGIRQLEGGSSIFAGGGEVTVKRFWRPSLQVDTALSEKEAITTTKALLRRAVARQLVADVPVGAFLSGGLDSSSLVALVKEAREGPLETFSVGFEDRSYDETPYARRVAQYFGTRHHQIIVRSSDFPALLREVVLHLDQPLGDPAAFALYCLSSLTRERVTVALSGDGADEIFVGYPTYHANRYLQWYRRIPRVLREHIVESLAHRLPTSTDKFSFDFRVKKFLEGAGLSSRKAHYSWRTIYTDEEKHSIFAPSVREHIRADSYAVYERHFEEAGDIDFTSQCLYADLRVWLAGNNLHKVDSMTMAHSLEARVPYLDQVLVEFMMRVPPDLKFKGHQSKYLLKKAMRGLLPEDVLRRRKAGWHIPLAGWFCHDLRSFLQDRFDNAPREFYKVFDRAEVQRILQEHIQKKRNHSFKLWGLLVLNEWFRVYNPCVELGVYRSVG